MLYYADTLQAKAIKLMASKLAVAGIIEGTFSEEGLAAMSDVKDLTSQMAKELAAGIRDNVEVSLRRSRKWQSSTPIERRQYSLRQGNPPCLLRISRRSRGRRHATPRRLRQAGSSTKDCSQEHRKKRRSRGRRWQRWMKTSCRSSISPLKGGDHLHITINRAELLAAVKRASTIAPPDSPLDVLRGVLLETDSRQRYAHRHLYQPGGLACRKAALHRS